MFAEQQPLCQKWPLNDNGALNLPSFHLIFLKQLTLLLSNLTEWNETTSKKQKTLSPGEES